LFIRNAAEPPPSAWLENLQRQVAQHEKPSPTLSGCIAVDQDVDFGVNLVVDFEGDGVVNIAALA